MAACWYYLSAFLCHVGYACLVISRFSMMLSGGKVCLLGLSPLTIVSIERRLPSLFLTRRQAINTAS